MSNLDIITENLDFEIKNIDDSIYENIEISKDFDRGFLSQNILKRLRDLIEHTAVKSNPVRMDIGSRGGMIRTFNDLAERIVSDSIFQKDRDILRRTVVIWIVKACGVAEMRSVHSQLLRLLIHQFHKSLLRSRYGVRQGNTAFRS